MQQGDGVQWRSGYGLGLPVRRPGFKSRQTAMDFSMCFSASPGGSKPTLNCRSTVSLAKRRLRNQQKITMATLRNQLKKLSVKRLRNQQKLKVRYKKLRYQLKNYGKMLRNQQQLGGANATRGRNWTFYVKCDVSSMS